MPSIFTRIIRGEIPCHKVGEDEHFLAFLDINPLREGHSLVIPKLEVDKFFDLPADVLAAIMPFAQEVAGRIAKVVAVQPHRCERGGAGGAACARSSHPHRFSLRHGFRQAEVAVYAGGTRIFC
jgi:diadenosine tetraphosphate (Ap4A) HIT family hydrolase